MRRLFKVLALAGAGLASAWGIAYIGAQEESKPVKSPRGGILTNAGNVQFEVFFYATGVRVFARDSAGAPVNASGLAGTVTFYHPNSPQPWFSRPLSAPSGQVSSLDVSVGLSNAPATGVRATIDVTGLSGSAESKVTFTVPVEFVPLASRPATTQRPVPTVPRYTYGAGSRGYGYYEYTSPGTYSTPSGNQSYMSSIPGMFGPGGMTVGPGHRDWTTGRPSPLAKPWLRPID